MSKIISTNSSLETPIYTLLDRFLASLTEGIYLVEESDGDKYIFVVAQNPDDFIPFVTGPRNNLLAVKVTNKDRKFRAITTLDLIPRD